MILYLRVYSYADLVCSLKTEVKCLPKIEEEIEINFDDFKVEYLEGKWPRPNGLYSFPITGYEDDVAICQLAMFDF